MRKYLSRVFGLLIVLVCMLLVPTNAHAVSNGWTLGAGLGSAKLWVGQQRNTDGLLVYCTDYERHSPTRAEPYLATREGAFARSDGSRLSQAENSALSYLLLRWGHTRDNLTAAAVQLSVWALTSPGRSWHSAGMAQIIAKASLPANAVSLGLSLTEQALRFAGPYRISLTLPRPGAASVSVLSAAGALVPGLAVEVKGAGTLSVAKTDRLWTSATSSHFVPVQRTGFGSGSLEASIDHAPAAALQWLVPKNPRTQRLISAGTITNVAAKISVKAAALQVAVRTETSTKILPSAGKLSDRLTVYLPPKDGKPQTWLNDPRSGKPVRLTITSTLWGPLGTRPKESALVPTGTPRLGTVSTAVSAAGTYSTPELAVHEPGYYVWTERIDNASAYPASAADFVRPWQGKFGVVSESSLLRWRPTISTELSIHRGNPGAAVVDHLRVQGTAPIGTAVRLTMYGPLVQHPVPSRSIPGGSPVFKTLLLPFATAHKADFGALPIAGCYTVVATIDESAEVARFQSSFGDPQETLCLQRASAPVLPPAPTPHPNPTTVKPPAAPAPTPVVVPTKAAMTPPGVGAEKLAHTGLPEQLGLSGAAGLLLALGFGLRHYARRSAKRR